MTEMTGHLKPVTSFSLVPSSKAKDDHVSPFKIQQDEKIWESKWAEAGSKTHREKREIEIQGYLFFKLSYVCGNLLRNQTWRIMNILQKPEAENVCVIILHP